MFLIQSSKRLETELTCFDLLERALLLRGEPVQQGPDGGLRVSRAVRVVQLPSDLGKRRLRGRPHCLP